ncbi:Choline dehydrogenase [Singulisphaera sp. GP187]|uniref:GMC family oxidoreductase n=1 Tax=Singulisphaera sp. GP187 TaxID=1882752 RepID=UPI0009281CBB|nr:GMC family oxidoreductase [Singulisphaera sp. GP187]SIO57734.1 Choline dehydrogenase [Singulisphaera sp. GP187]
MIFPPGAMHRMTVEAVSEKTYDAVIVGSGISGSIIAKELAAAGKHVLILEAGPGGDRTLSGYEDYLNRYYATAAKDNQSPYPLNANASMPRSTDARKITPGQPNTSAYLVQNGPLSTDTTYTRVLGGTTMHWEAKILRMLPEDFEMRTRFGHGEDWPLGYQDLEKYYEMAEREMGVSGDAVDQPKLGVKFNGYVFPMQGLPLSYLDRMVANGIDGTKVKVDGEVVELKVRAFPQGRNGIPNAAYDGGKGYVPIGAVSTSQVEVGGRCQGNNNCVPICPIQAKYHAGKTLAKALQTGRVDILAQSVASKVCYDRDNGRITHIEFKTYHDPSSPQHVKGTARGHIFVLGANAIENPRLLLASAVPNTSGLIGRNLMDHAYLLSWALMPVVCGTMRGTNCTGGITDLRGGSFRNKQAAFSVDIHNDGWGWAAGSPASDLLEMVDSRYKFGAELRHDLADRITRQLQFAFMVEVLPNPSNRVGVDPAYTDQLGNMRPVISFSVPDYTMRGVAYARQFARLMFQRLGAADHTAYDPSDYGYQTYEGEGYAIRGGNHLGGTHVMGTNKSNSVVNPDLRSWDHENLFLVGGGSMPTIGTANVTNTLAALCFKSVKAMLKQLS